MFSQICNEKGWKFRTELGYQKKLKVRADITSFAHSLIDFDREKLPIVGFHVVRDPRDIIVSGYLYHLRTSEKWCVNTNFSKKSPIIFPRVPYSQEHRTEQWKLAYLNSLQGKSYQEYLQTLDQREGLLFEMENYGAWTIDSLEKWDFNRQEILEIKFESLADDYESTFLSIFQHIGLSEPDIELCMDVAVQHDLGRKTVDEIKLIPHVSSPKLSKWKEYFENVHKEVFLEKFGDILIRLGYEDTNDW